MAISNGYTTLAAFKVWASFGSGTTHDADIERAVEAGSRAIDRYCGRRFYADSSASARYYTPEIEQVLYLPVDDISSLTDLAVKTDNDWDGTWENTWTKDGRTASYGFMLQPTNAAALGRPWTRLHAIASSFPTVPQGVQVTAKWGWPTLPSDIVEACLLLAGRYLKRKDTPFGIMGVEGVGMITLPKLDPDVAALLGPYRRMDSWGD